VQDRALVHVGASGPASERRPAVIGSRVTVGKAPNPLNGLRRPARADAAPRLTGQGAVLHSCDVHDEAVIGIGSHVLDGATVEKHGMLGAGSILAPGATIKAGEVRPPAEFLCPGMI